VNNGCYLYRHFDNDKNLLYVGISLSVATRLMQHRQNSGWFDRISLVTVEKFPSREEALKAEVEAIKSENPRFNIQGKRKKISVELSRVCSGRTEISKKYSMREKGKNLKIKVGRFFNQSGGFHLGAEEKWEKLKEYARKHRSISFWERIESIEDRMREISNFLENYDKDYLSDDEKPRSVQYFG